MNKEVVKAMNKKENRFDEMRKWWNKNGYKNSCNNETIR